MAVCAECGGTQIEYDQAAGNGSCVRCGTVVEENTIVNEVAFGETSNGAAMVQGSFVGQGATHARMSGPYGNRGSNESREQTIANASKRIQSISNAMSLSEVVCLAATRLYTLAVEHKFTKGRKGMNVVAVCLYVACRQKETRNYMLIDFSDLLQVNVFELGHTYLQLVQTLNLRLPLVDPSHYISRFAALLEFGDETHKVATDAVRLVQRFDRDWMTRGRRPAGICGAALLLAARMNNFRRSIEEIVQVVKIADTTLKKRLEEFKSTPSGALTLADFRNVWLEDEMDPPAFTKGKEREEAERLAALEGSQREDVDENGNWIGPTSPKGKSKKGGKKRKGKRKRGEESDGEGVEQQQQFIQHHPHEQALFLEDGQMLTDEMLVAALDPLSFGQPHMLPDDNNIDPALLQQSMLLPQHSLPPNSVQMHPPPLPPMTPAPPPSNPIDDQVGALVAQEVAAFLTNSQGSEITSALNEADERRVAGFAVVDELMGLDEAELDRLILSEEEVKIKERVWVELNKDYLEAIAARGDQDQNATKARKRRKTNNKPRDTSNAAGDTPAESVKNLLKKNPKYSKRINYEALKDLFVDSGGLPSLAGAVSMGDDDKDDAELFTMDDKSDGEGVSGLGFGRGGGAGADDAPTVIVEEEPGTVVVLPDEPSASRKKKKGVLGMGMDLDADVDAEHDGEEEEDDEEKEDDVLGGWEDAYEQEV